MYPYIYNLLFEQFLVVFARRWVLDFWFQYPLARVLSPNLLTSVIRRIGMLHKSLSTDLGKNLLSISRNDVIISVEPKYHTFPDHYLN